VGIAKKLADRLGEVGKQTANSVVQNLNKMQQFRS